MGNKTDFPILVCYKTPSFGSTFYIPLVCLWWNMTHFKWKESRIRYEVLIRFFIVIATSAVYWRIGKFEFIEYDDHEYIIHNPHIQEGLTIKSITWSFKATYAVNWHPVTWLSHILDVELYGMDPGMHHRTNQLFHILNTLLLFHVLRRATGDLWPSCFVAVVFALHPLQVESVAWVSERKNVLSTFFWMMTLWAYIRYVDHPVASRYTVVLLFFVLGLMAKPMLVTLPFVLLLLDYWPLDRVCRPATAPNVDDSSNRRSINPEIIKEKIPLFVLAAAASVVTFLVQKSGGAVKSLDLYPMAVRVGNMFVSYLNYMIKIVWPFKLAIFYPHPMAYPFWKIAVAGLILVSISIFALRFRRQRPYFAVGWLWYMGTLVPVIGLVQVGLQAMADRYTYVPMIGMLVIIAWGIPDLLSRWRYKIIGFKITGAAVALFFAMITWFQVPYWTNTATLFAHALEVTPNNYEILYKLGEVFLARKKVDRAIYYFDEAVRNFPDARAHNSLGYALLEKGRIDEAIDHFHTSLRIDPSYPRTQNNLGNAFAYQGMLDKAIAHYRKALKINPNSEIHNNLGLALIRKGTIDKAVYHFRKALELTPDYQDAFRNLERGLAVKERIDLTVSSMIETLKISVDDAEVNEKIKYLYRAKQLLDEAIEYYQVILSAQPGYREDALDIGNYEKVRFVLKEYDRTLLMLKTQMQGK